MKKILPLVLVILIGLLFILGRTKFPTTLTSDQGKINIVTSFYPLYYFTTELAGNRAEVTNLTPVGTEPHDYEPTPQDVVKLEKSDLVIINGGGFEPWVNSIGNQQKIVSTAKMATDPHIWLSPVLAKQQASTILDALLIIDPSGENEYRMRAQIIFAKFDELNRKFELGLKNCQKRDFITSHAAFSYLAKAYKLNQISISGISPEEEPSLQKLASLADLARQKDVEYIFFESLVSPKYSETIAHEIGAKTLVLDPLEGLSNTDMKAGRNYFTIMEDNLANLRTALACQ